MKMLMMNGSDFTLPNGETEHFNIIPIMCADLGFVKGILGKCATNGKYGCYYCKKKFSEWDQKISNKAESQTISQMVLYGKKAVEILGDSPDHNTKEFTNFQHNHIGQYAMPLFDGFEIKYLMPPCGLHLILAHHRYLWSYVIHVILMRKQEELVFSAFKAIDCNYLAYQLKCYYNAKSKYYDGSDTLKMIGEDCKQMERNIEKFISVFLRKEETINCSSAATLRRIITLYHMFADIAQDIRSTHYDCERVENFQSRVNVYYNRFCDYAPAKCTDGKPYMHILRDHIYDIMKFWGEVCDWGYGYFNCNGSEHLNKRIKSMEHDVTNMKEDRFLVIMRHLRIKQLHYPEELFQENRKITCTACKQEGHNKKNKNCPLHECQVQLEFSDTDDDE